MKIQQENIREYPKIREIHKHFLSWTIIRYLKRCQQSNVNWTSEYLFDAPTSVASMLDSYAPLVQHLLFYHVTD